jgi:hypothetical protein
MEAQCFTPGKIDFTRFSGVAHLFPWTIGQNKGKMRLRIFEVKSSTQVERFAKHNTSELVMNRFRIVAYVLAGGFLITGWSLSSSSSNSSKQVAATVSAPRHRPTPSISESETPRRYSRRLRRLWREQFSSGKWRSATAQERRAAITLISAQLRAFRKGDYELAARYQNNAMRSRTGAPQTLRHIIENGYPQFANAKQVYYGETFASDKGDVLRLRVQLVTQEDEVCRAHYHLIKEGNAYRIESVRGGGVINKIPDEPAPVLIEPQETEW